MSAAALGVCTFVGICRKTSGCWKHRLSNAGASRLEEQVQAAPHVLDRDLQRWGYPGVLGLALACLYQKILVLLHKRLANVLPGSSDKASAVARRSQVLCPSENVQEAGMKPRSVRYQAVALTGICSVDTVPFPKLEWSLSLLLGATTF